MRRKLWLITLAFVVVAVLVGCAKSTPAPSPAPPPATSKAASSPAASSPAGTTAAPKTSAAPAPSPSGSAKPAAAPITLKFATYASPTEGTVGMAHTWIKDEIEKRSNGRLKVEVYWSETLAKATELIYAAGGGLADIVGASATQTPDLVPFAAAARDFFTFTGYDDPLGAFTKVRQELPEASADFQKQNVKFLGTWVTGTQTIVTRKIQLNKISDMKGLKIAATGDLLLKFLASTGAVPVSMRAAECYDAMSKGVVEGNVSSVEVVNKYKQYEVAKYLSFWGPGKTVSHLTLIGLGTWNKLPPDLQAIVAGVGADVAVQYAKWDDELDAKNQQTLKDKGMTLTTIAKADFATARDAVMGQFYEDLVKRVEKLGYPQARKVFDRWSQISDYNPYKK